MRIPDHEMLKPNIVPTLSPRRKTASTSIGLLPSSPIGPLWVAISDFGVVAVDWDMSQQDFTEKILNQFRTTVAVDEFRTKEALQQISEYLSGIRKQFDLQIDLIGMSPFQKEVLQRTLDIPYGQTLTYKQIAIQLGNSQAARAVGRVEATNPIPLVIPCHRVIGTDGKLHGYGGPGGVALKAWLLELERARI
jgi:methylated-DNA-[protein]-cysteine S-methyltransferase